MFLEKLLQIVNMLQAKSTIFRLVESIEQGQEREIVIALNGRPVAKLVPIDITNQGKRIGVAKGLFEIPDSIDTNSDEVAMLFMEGDNS